MTATDELRRLLDERGVEWWETTTFIGATITSDGIERHYLVSTWWNSPVFGRVEATDMGDGVLHMACLNGCDITPAQAIAATLGAGTCRYEIAFFGDGKVWFACSECGGMASADYDPPKYCPHCGRKVVDE